MDFVRWTKEKLKATPPYLSKLKYFSCPTLKNNFVSSLNIQKLEKKKPFQNMYEAFS